VPQTGGHRFITIVSRYSRFALAWLDICLALTILPREKVLLALAILRSVVRVPCWLHLLPRAL
jgi:hypothetical protein